MKRITDDKLIQSIGYNFNMVSTNISDNIWNRVYGKMNQSAITMVVLKRAIYI